MWERLTNSIADSITVVCSYAGAYCSTDCCAKCIAKCSTYKSTNKDRSHLCTIKCAIVDAYSIAIECTHGCSDAAALRHHCHQRSHGCTD